ncbi:MAG TPA: ferritin-like domain-containing protein [Xanthomonadaceae bacterium]|jgi:bacterioferritin
MSKTSSAVLKQLNLLLEIELSGVARYLHYSFMIMGPNRIPITKWFRDQATEAMDHGVLVGEKVSAYGGHPSVKVRQVPENDQHDIKTILMESLNFEREALDEYHKLLKLAGDDVSLEELARKQIVTETAHIEEVEKMLRGMK